MSNLDALHRLRRTIKGPVLNFQQLSYALQDYAAPRDVITRWLKRGDIIRVKKGFYVLGEKYRDHLIELELVANQLYGPSYVSCEYALQYYGLIPEAVHEITSVTTKRNKAFDTPIGRFSYRPLNKKRFPIGIAYMAMHNNLHALIATKEKALADLIFFKKIKARDSTQLLEIILENYRIDEEGLKEMDIMHMLEITKHYNNSIIDLLPYVLKEVQNAS